MIVFRETAAFSIKKCRNAAKRTRICIILRKEDFNEGLQY